MQHHGSGMLWSIRLINTFALLQVHVLNPELLSEQPQPIGTGGPSDNIAWSDVDKRHLVLPLGMSPARQLLALRAKAAINYAVPRGWKQPGELTVPDEGCAPPGCDPVLLQRFLRDTALGGVALGRVQQSGEPAGEERAGEELGCEELGCEERASTGTASEI